MCLPNDVLSSTGRRPNLSDHGPIKKLMNAGMMFSRMARHINSLDAYSSSAISICYRKYLRWFENVKLILRILC